LKIIAAKAALADANQMIEYWVQKCDDAQQKLRQLLLVATITAPKPKKRARQHA
jgi:hypothetical protein